MLVDNDDAVKLLQLLVIQKMSLEGTLIRQEEVLNRFNGHTSIAISKITLYMRIPPVVSKETFTIGRDPSPYNGILGQP